MTKEEIILRISQSFKLIRTEAGYSQDKMAEIIGISKKTLVQIEKDRTLASWSTVVSVSALFRETNTIKLLLGNEPLEVIETIAREGLEFRKEKTLGGKVWWRELDKKKGFILQQNIISQHYRILDEDFYRIYSSIDEESARLRFEELLMES